MILHVGVVGVVGVVGDGELRWHCVVTDNITELLDCVAAPVPRVQLRADQQQVVTGNDTGST
jgi:hypothetical protein